MADLTEGLLLLLEHKTGKYYEQTGKERMTPHGHAAVEEIELVIMLSKNPDIRVCRKAIQPGKTTIEIYKSDLYNKEEKAAMGEKAESKDEVPWQEFLGYAYAGHKFTEVVILVPEDVAKPKWQSAGMSVGRAGTTGN